jgi:hypothetical protein
MVIQKPFYKVGNYEILIPKWHWFFLWMLPIKSDTNGVRYKQFKHYTWIMTDDYWTFWERIIWCRVFFGRFFRRLCYTLRLKQMWTFECESCDHCGRCYHLPTLWRDEIWLAVNGQDSGCLCAECFIELALKRGIDVGVGDIELLWIFTDSKKDSVIIDKIGQFK